MNQKPSRYRRRRKRTTRIKTPKIVIPRKDNTAIIYIIAPLLFLGGILFFSIFSHLFILDLIDYFKFFFCTYLSSLAVPISFYRKYFTISYYEFIILNLISLSPFILIIAFSINYLIPIKETTETYSTKKVIYSKKLSKNIVFLMDGKYSDNEAIRTIYDWNSSFKSGRKKYTITYSTGIFGIKMYEHQTLKK